MMAGVGSIWRFGIVAGRANVGMPEDVGVP